MPKRIACLLVLPMLFATLLSAENRHVPQLSPIVSPRLGGGSGELGREAVRVASTLVSAGHGVDLDLPSGGWSSAVLSFLAPPEGPVAAAMPWVALLALLVAAAWMGVRQRHWRLKIQSIDAALNCTADGLLVVNDCGAIVTYNRRFLELWGIQPDVLQARQDDVLIQFVLPQLEDPDEFLAAVQRLNDNPQSTGEDIIKFKDGRVCERHSEPHRVGNRIVGRVWGFRDVTSARMRELALQEKGHAFRTFIDSLPDNIYFKDRESRFTRVNQACAITHGYNDYRDMVGKSDFDSCAEVHAREAYADEQSLVNEIVPIVSKEEKETWPDGRQTWVLTTKMPLRDMGGEIAGTFGISRDITERKRMEQALGERERWLSAVLGSIRDSVVALDSLGIIQWINPSAAELTGWSFEDCCGKLFEDVVRLAETGPVFEGAESRLMNSLLSGRVSSLERLKATVMKADGSSVPIEFTGSVIEIGGNVIAGAVLVLRAIGGPAVGFEYENTCRL